MGSGNPENRRISKTFRRPNDLGMELGPGNLEMDLGLEKQGIPIQGTKSHPDIIVLSGAYPPLSGLIADYPSSVMDICLVISNQWI